MKQIRLTRRRRQWAEPRQAVIKGEPLGYPAAARERYQAAIERLIAPMRKEYERELRKLLRTIAEDHALTMDANDGSQARILLNRLDAKWQKLFGQASGGIVDRMMSQVDRQSKTILGNSLKKLSGGLTIKTPVMPAALQASATASVAENVALIRSVQAQYHERIQGAVLRSIQSGGQGQKTVYDELLHIGGLADKRARLIARDQTKKITATTNAERAKSVGMRKFQWLHSGGGAEPRELHLELDGQIFDYDDLPVIGPSGERGLPGQLINCNCQAIPVIDFGDEDLLDEA